MLFWLFLRVPFDFGITDDYMEFTQKLDHNDNHDTRTFKQRYVQNMEYAPSDFKNVVLYIGGESTLNEKSVKTGAAVELAKRTNAALFALEHRYFGKSQPFKELTTENYKYLTIDQALADLANFIDYIKTLTKNQIRVVVVGGSYPGSLSSWFRLKYPHYAYASWSSSGPLNAKNDFYEYDGYISEQLKKQSESCYKNTKALFDEFESIVQDGRFKILKSDFGMPDDTDPVSALYILADVLSAFVQYNSRTHLLEQHCENQQSCPSYTDYVTLFKKGLESFGESISDLDLMKQTNTSSESPNVNGRSWSYMTCNEVGWFQTKHVLRSGLINLTYFEKVCKTLFNIGLADTEQTNKLYGSIHPKSSNVFFTNSDVDPWSVLGIKSVDGSLRQMNVVIANESHCSDLSAYNQSNNKPLYDAQTAIIGNLTEWMNEESCDGKCVHGSCYFSKCACDEGYGGKFCDVEVTDKYNFDVAIILGVSIPVVAVVIIIFSAWFFVYRKRQYEPILN